MATCLLVRHGHSTANAEGLLAGWTPGVGLTDRGREQVTRLAGRLRGIPLARVVSSPLQRCTDTAAALVAGQQPCTVALEEDLGECRYGGWTGRLLKDLATDPLWQVVQREPEVARFPDGDGYAAESLAEMADRVWAAVRRHDDEVEGAAGRDAVWVAVSHGDPIRSVLAEAVGGGVAQLQRLHVDPASVSVVRWVDGRPMVLAANHPGKGLGRLVVPPERDAELPEGDAVVGGGTG